MAKDLNDRLLEGKPLDLEGEPWPESSPADPSQNTLEKPAMLHWDGDDPALYETEPPAREWLIRAGLEEHAPGFLSRGEVGILAAPGSSGKTWAMVALAIAVALGRPWLGYRTTAKGGRVALLMAEETRDELRRRIRAQAAAMYVRPGDLAGRLSWVTRADMPPEGPTLVYPVDGPFSSLAGSLSPFGQRVLASLHEKAQERGPWDLIIADPLSAFGPPDCEIDNASATATMRAIERLCELPGNPAVLVTHHTRKGAGKEGAAEADDIRGASGLVNRARWAATLSRLPPSDRWPGSRFTCLQVVKSNYAPDVDPLVYVHPAQAHGAIRAADPDERATVTPKRKADTMPIAKKKPVTREDTDG